jgi:hypothetical protein
MYDPIITPGKTWVLFCREVAGPVARHASGVSGGGKIAGGANFEAQPQMTTYVPITFLFILDVFIYTIVAHWGVSVPLRPWLL